MTESHLAAVTYPDDTAISANSTDAETMDADVLYDLHLIARLAGSPRANCLLADRDFEDGD